MLIHGIDGKEYKLNIRERSCNDMNRSELHLRARQLISEIYPYDIVREEVELPGTKTKFNKYNLIADFFIPSRSIIVEVHGRQHTDYIRHFHKNKLAFLKSQNRDNVKKQWCLLNNIELIELYYNEAINDWRNKF